MSGPVCMFLYSILLKTCSSFKLQIRLRLLQEETVSLLTTPLTPNVWVLRSKQLSVETNRMFYNLVLTLPCVSTIPKVEGLNFTKLPPQFRCQLKVVISGVLTLLSNLATISSSHNPLSNFDNLL